MPRARTDVELSIERELAGGDPAHPTRVRLSARLAPAPGEDALPPEEIRAALEALRAELDAALGPSASPAPPAPHRERELAELVETYRPRQSELVDLLEEEGELSATEHRLLTEYLRERRSPATPEPVRAPPPAPTEAASPPAMPARPIAAAPLEADRTPSASRTVAELLEVYQISSLKQAGAVRARRQISFDEYMALKRHFGGTGPAPGAPAP
jgi:hypothetical protein